MQDLAPLVTDVQEAFQELTERLKTFHATITADAHVKLHYLAWVPYRTAQKSNLRKQSLDQPDEAKAGNERAIGTQRASVEELYAPGTQSPASREALKVAFNALVNIQYEPDQDAKSTVRCPRVIAVSGKTLQAALDLNTAKANFKQAVLAIPQRSRRSLSRMLPNIVFLQAYRSLVILEETPCEMDFFWSVNHNSIKRRTAQELVEQLEKERDATPSSDVDMLNAIDYDLERVSRFAPTEVLAIRRPLQPRILCNVKPWDEQYFQYQKDGHLPILVPAEDKNEPVRIGALNTHESKNTGPGGQRKKERSDVKFEREPISERLYIFRYKEAYREHKAN